MSQSPAGWYPQPDGRQRYWDGQQWTEHFAPAHEGAQGQGVPQSSATGNTPKRAWYAKKRVLIPGALVALIVVIGALSGGGDDPTKDAASVAVQSGANAEPVDEPVAGPSSPKPATSAAKPAAKPAPAKPAPAKPAAPKVGATVRDGKFAFTVRSVKCGISTVGTNPYLQEKAQGQFCAVALTVENIGDEPQSMFADNQFAFDGKGRKFSANSMASIADESSQVLWEEINPGNSVKGKVYFDLPKGASLAKLELHDSMFSGGVTVAAK